MRLEPFKYKVFRLDWWFLSSHIEKFLQRLFAGMPLGERSQLPGASITLWRYCTGKSRSNLRSSYTRFLGQILV
ncbi:MAG TPA: hypothetical protein VLA84_00935 [Microcoleus sp.]|nr:hypothetical protein [Microcoleus sp.]